MFWWVTLLPIEFLALGQDIAAAALSLGNVLSWFQLKRGYSFRSLS
ncbi:MAG: hypothetical protein IJ934_00525 [Acetobacter sp.]|nr:hypothetical protein [Acetobacter sp.]